MVTLFNAEIKVLAFVLVPVFSMTGSLAQIAQPAPRTGAQGPSSSGSQTSDQTTAANISGTIVDQSGAVVTGARVVLSGEQFQPREVLSGADGQFSFNSIRPGPYRLTVTAVGFETQMSSGTLQPGQFAILPRIVLPVASNKTEIRVGVSQTEVAEEQIKIEEKQRVLGAIPNFYVSYIPNAAPLNAKQKFKLASKTMIDPFTFVVVGGAAGVQQAQDHFHGYGQGAEGYARRFGAGYADSATSTFIGGAILPTLFKQDPRYFYKGTGSTMSRIRYAIKMSVICKGDNGHWQLNYSFLLGSLAAGGISNLYYPDPDRGSRLTFENAGVGIVEAGLTNLLQEFLIRKLTPKAPHNDPAQP
ncbi:MAG: carboxypeptidase regulatory-like domain-containing protein [Acidobacteriaceae bacterium]|nr:carboxypeptidase regulatory-like domain-containing protein [Acidobacteriaceae bacterium]